MNNQKASLYDTDWQKLRVSTLGQNNTYGGWTTPEGTKINIELFRDYLEQARGSIDQMQRAWRILNMLNAIRMGNSGQDQKDSEHDKMVMQFRDDEIKPLYEVLRNEGHEWPEWDWNKEEQKIKELQKNDPVSWGQILNNLQNRHDTTLKRIETVENRPELVKYLEILNK